MKIVTVCFALVLLSIPAALYFGAQRADMRDDHAVLAFQGHSSRSRDDIIRCLSASRPTGLNLSAPELINGFTDDFGTFGGIALRRDDLFNGARHIFGRVDDTKAGRALRVWTRPGVRLTTTDLVVFKTCTAAG